MSDLFAFAAQHSKRLPDWARSVNGRLALFLAIVVGLLFLLVGIVNSWHHGAGEGSTTVDVIWRTVWITYKILQVWLVVILVILLYRRGPWQRNL